MLRLCALINAKYSMKSVRIWPRASTHHSGKPNHVSNQLTERGSLFLSKQTEVNQSKQIDSLNSRHLKHDFCVVLAGKFVAVCS